MPRPCAVEPHARGYKIGEKGFADATALRRGPHARGYKIGEKDFADATALCRGASRSRLQNRRKGFCGCHGLVPWSLTFAATK
jgi:hypothetical protein